MQKIKDFVYNPFTRPKWTKKLDPNSFGYLLHASISRFTLLCVFDLRGELIAIFYHPELWYRDHGADQTQTRWDISDNNQSAFSRCPDL